MVLRVKTWESRSLPGLPSQQSTSDRQSQTKPQAPSIHGAFRASRSQRTRRRCKAARPAEGQGPERKQNCGRALNPVQTDNAGWRSPLQRRAKARSAHPRATGPKLETTENNAGWRSPVQRRAKARSAHPRATGPKLETTENNAGWSSPVARQAHNLKVVSSNLAPATKKGQSVRAVLFLWAVAECPIKQLRWRYRRSTGCCRHSRIAEIASSLDASNP